MGDDETSYAYSIAPADYWDLVDCVAVISRVHKPTGSTEGHALADTSPLQAARLADAPRRLDLCRQAILERDFEALAQVVELDSNMMHAVMMTSSPPLVYWQPATLAIMHAVSTWRQQGLPACYTNDAGPNVHVLCLQPGCPRGDFQAAAHPWRYDCPSGRSRRGGAAGYLMTGMKIWMRLIVLEQQG